MEIRNVRTFMMAAELKNFTKTGEALGYSQASVTAQIKQLETSWESGFLTASKTGLSSLRKAGISFPTPYL